MELDSLFARFEKEFEIELPEHADEKMAHVKAMCDFIRKDYARQGVECSSGVIFDRVRRLMAIVLRIDEGEIRPATRFADVVARRSTAA